MDVLITGAGVSALLLAQQLVAQQACTRVRLVGPWRPLAPHVLSYWSDGPTLFDAHAIAHWTRLGVVGRNGISRSVSLGRFGYRTFRAQAWADAARAELTASGRVEWIDAAVEAVEDGPSRAQVRTADQQLEADWVFVSHRAPATPPAAWQRFLGWEIAVDAPLFTTETATFMDFRTPPERDFRFVYALPLAPDRLFVEHVSYQPCDHARHLRDYLRRALGLRDWRLLDSERGATPVFAAPPPRRGQRVIEVGVAAGLAKTATGYALMRMLRDAESLARSLRERGEPRLPRRTGFLYRLADRYFLEALRRDPERLVVLLGALFSGPPGDAVLGFLDERARFREKLAVARAVPGWLRWWMGRLWNRDLTSVTAR